MSSGSKKLKQLKDQVEYLQAKKILKRLTEEGKGGKRVPMKAVVKGDISHLLIHNWSLDQKEQRE